MKKHYVVLLCSVALIAGDVITLWLTGAGFIPNVAGGAASGAAIPTPIPPISVHRLAGGY